MDGLIQLRRPEDVAKLRGLSVNQVLGLDKMAEAKKLAAEGDEAGAGDAVAVAVAEPAAPEPAAPETSPSSPAEEKPADG